MLFEVQFEVGDSNIEFTLGFVRKDGEGLLEIFICLFVADCIILNDGLADDFIVFENRFVVGINTNKLLFLYFIQCFQILAN